MQTTLSVKWITAPAEYTMCKEHAENAVLVV